AFPPSGALTVADPRTGTGPGASLRAFALRLGVFPRVDQARRCLIRRAHRHGPNVDLLFFGRLHLGDKLRLWRPLDRNRDLLFARQLRLLNRLFLLIAPTAATTARATLGAPDDRLRRAIEQHRVAAVIGLI